MDFMSSSVNNAKKVAAIVPLAGCNSSNPAGASNTATQKVRYWGIHCLYDQTCPSNNTVSWPMASTAIHLAIQWQRPT